MRINFAYSSPVKTKHHQRTITAPCFDTYGRLYLT